MTYHLFMTWFTAALAPHPELRATQGASGRGPLMARSRTWRWVFLRSSLRSSFHPCRKIWKYMNIYIYKQQYCEWTNDPSHVLAFLSHVHSLPCMFRKVCVEWWSGLCDLISLLLTAWGFTWRRGNPQPLWLTGSSWWEGWGSAWSHRIEANPFWFAEDSIYRWHQCLWISCFGSLATFTILAACEKDLERLGGGEGEFLPVWSDSHW